MSSRGDDCRREMGIGGYTLLFHRLLYQPRPYRSSDYDRQITSLARCNDDRRAVASWIVLRGYFTRKIAQGVVRAVSPKSDDFGDSSLDLNTSSWYMLTHGHGLLVSTQISRLICWGRCGLSLLACCPKTRMIAPRFLWLRCAPGKQMH